MLALQLDSSFLSKANFLKLIQLWMSAFEISVSSRHSGRLRKAGKHAMHSCGHTRPVRRHSNICQTSAKGMSLLLSVVCQSTSHGMLYQADGTEIPALCQLLQIQSQWSRGINFSWSWIVYRIWFSYSLFNSISSYSLMSPAKRLP